MAVKFQTKNGDILPGCNPLQWETRFKEASSDTFSPIPSAAFSFAMVIRYALGLSSEGGCVAGFATDTPFGWIVLATLKHLADNGCNCVAYLVQGAKGPTAELTSLCDSLKNRDCEVEQWNDPNSPSWADRIGSFHNILCGLRSNDSELKNFQAKFGSIVNEEPVPIHSVGLPLGIDEDSGLSNETAVFSSSTISLGLPFTATHLSSEYVGRHYLCDISFSRKIYAELGYTGAPIFREQPVLQISPAT